jgi:hypothetical protein
MQTLAEMFLSGDFIPASPPPSPSPCPSSPTPRSASASVSASASASDTAFATFPSSSAAIPASASTAPSSYGTQPSISVLSQGAIATSSENGASLSGQEQRVGVPTEEQGAKTAGKKGKQKNEAAVAAAAANNTQAICKDTAEMGTGEEEGRKNVVLQEAQHQKGAVSSRIKYGGIIFTSQRAVEAFLEVLHSVVGTKALLLLSFFCSAPSLSLSRARARTFLSSLAITRSLDFFLCPLFSFSWFFFPFPFLLYLLSTKSTLPSLPPSPAHSSLYLSSALIAENKTLFLSLPLPPLQRLEKLMYFTEDENDKKSKEKII